MYMYMYIYIYDMCVCVCIYMCVCVAFSFSGVTVLELPAQPERRPGRHTVDNQEVMSMTIQNAVESGVCNGFESHLN